MEIANLETSSIRVATHRDTEQIWRLIHESIYTHSHADWFMNERWLGSPGFILSEGSGTGDSTTVYSHRTDQLKACLAVGADPLPAFWVRLAAIRRQAGAQEILGEMFEKVIPFMRDQGGTILGWLAVNSWPDQMLPALGFRRENWITTFVKEGVDSPVGESTDVLVRKVRLDELDELARIETAAFDPLWRYSPEGLRLAYRHAICFEVAILDGKVVGFQYSVLNSDNVGAHLVRITVHPDVQGFGVGSALLQSAFRAYQRRGLRRVSLNTQLDNIPSHRLYEKFGFYRTGDQLPVWVLDLE